MITLLWHKHFGFVFHSLLKRYPSVQEDDLQMIASDLFALHLPEQLEKNGHEFTGAASVRKWLLAVAKNKLIDHLRKMNTLQNHQEAFVTNEKKVHAMANLHDDLRHLDTAGLQLDEIDFAEKSVVLAIGMLSELSRECILLYYFLRSNYEEISNRLEVTHDTVRGTLYNAKKRLAKVAGRVKEKEVFASDWVPDEDIVRFLAFIQQDFRHELPLIKTLLQLSIGLLEKEQREWISDYLIGRLNLLELSRKYKKPTFREEFSIAIQSVTNALEIYFRVETIKMNHGNK